MSRVVSGKRHNSISSRWIVPRKIAVKPELVSLLITDVVMPEMSGRNLANQIHCLSPKIKTLFMSGYTANVIAHNGVLDEGVNFIQKPFSLHDLGIKVRRVLDEK